MKVRIIMRKHCARKWLHFTIDLLPFVVIPIFAIWGINHGDYNKDVEISYKFETNEVVSSTDIVEGNIYHCDTLYFCNEYDYDNLDFIISIYSFDSYECNDYADSYPDEIYVDSYDSVHGNCLNFRFRADTDEADYFYLLFTNESCYLNYLYWTPWDVAHPNITFYDCDFVVTSGYYQFIDLLEEGHDYDYAYNNVTASTYNVIDSVEVVGVGIGEAFYNSIIDTSNKYFNFDNVFNFGELKEWFNVNFFSGSMPPLINVLFNVIFYEFITDIIMLIYTFFMFIIDFANDLLERPFSDIKRG